jgi:hypothetical protein
MKKSIIQDGATTTMGADRVTGSASRASPRGSLNACRGVFAADRQSEGEVVLVLTTSQVTLILATKQQSIHAIVTSSPLPFILITTSSGQKIPNFLVVAEAEHHYCQ